MNQHPVVLLDPVFRWLEPPVRGLWTLHLHGLSSGCRLS